MLAKVKARTGLPILTDIHEVGQVAPAAEVVDILQIPGVPVAPDRPARGGGADRPRRERQEGPVPRAARHAPRRRRSSPTRATRKLLVTERGVSFGYNNLVVDPRAFPMLRELGYPVIFDVTHSLQLPGAGDGVTAGLAQYIQPMSQAGVAAGVDGVFMEVHEEPSRAKSDAANALRLDLLEPLMQRLVALDKIVRHA